VKKLQLNPSLLISMVALFVALGGVSYAAATIGSAEIKNNSVRSKDVKNGDLRGKDLKANTIGGSRVLESSLGKVPSAAKADTAGSAGTAGSATTASNADALSGVGLNDLVRGNDSYDALCNPTNATFIDCTGATITLPRTSKVMIQTSGEWYASATPSRGTCVLQQNEVTISDAFQLGELTNNTDSTHEAAMPSFLDVRGPLPAGNYRFEVSCNEPEGDIAVTDLRTSVVMVGNG
jgi:hypothetical protein